LPNKPVLAARSC